MTTPYGDSTARAAFAGGRVTHTRRLIAETACTFQRAFTIDELADRVRENDPAGGSTATVYRAVAAMEMTGFLARVGEREGHSLYARCGAEDHHHHIVCDECGRIAHAECPLEAAIEAAARDGFVITRHEVTMYGLCPACAARTGS